MTGIEIRPLITAKGILNRGHPLIAVEYVGTQQQLTSLGLAASHWFPQGRKRKTFGTAPIMEGRYYWGIERKGSLYCLRVDLDLNEPASARLTADISR